MTLSSGMLGRQLFVVADVAKRWSILDDDGRAGDRGSMVDALRDVSSSRRWLGLSRGLTPGLSVDEAARERGWHVVETCVDERVRLLEQSVQCEWPEPVVVSAERGSEGASATGINRLLYWRDLQFVSRANQPGPSPWSSQLNHTLAHAVRASVQTKRDYPQNSLRATNERAWILLTASAAEISVHSLRHLLAWRILNSSTSYSASARASSCHVERRIGTLCAALALAPVSKPGSTTSTTNESSTTTAHARCFSVGSRVRLLSEQACLCSALGLSVGRWQREEDPCALLHLHTPMTARQCSRPPDPTCQLLEVCKSKAAMPHSAVSTPDAPS